MLDNVDALREFIFEQCSAPYSCGTQANESSPSTVIAPRMAVDLDLMHLVDAWPEAADLMSAGPINELLVLVKNEVVAILQQNPRAFSLRPLHVPPTIPSVLSPSQHNARGQTVVLVGTIVRIYSKRVVPYATQMRCPKCTKGIEILSDPFDRGGTAKNLCPQKACKGQELVLVSQDWMDYTECRLQPRSTGSEGKLPRSITVTLDDELASKCSAGQLVEVIGVAKPRWKSTYAKAVPQIEVVVWAQNVVPREESNSRRVNVSDSRTSNEINPKEFGQSFGSNHNLLRTRLLMSTCPQLSGLEGPRLGVLLSSIGGAEVRDEKTGHRVRGSVHCLLVGDPSTGKSQLLRFAAQIATRSVVTTGFTSSSAGLTAAATKEFGEWALEPGALVLSDGGTCVIDELRTVNNSDRTALHEAMEQQTISIAKAGLVTRLRTECTIVAACNPPMRRGSLASKGIASDLGIGGPLLSRFDFIFLLWDSGSDALDDTVASHIVRVTAADFNPPLSTEQLCKYLSYVRLKYAKTGGPLLDDTAADLIARFYHDKRRRISHTLCDDVPITIRFLESLVRIAQSHAKLVLKEFCDVDDAAMAIFIMERSAHKTNAILWKEADGREVRTGDSALGSFFLKDDPHSLQLQAYTLEMIKSLFSRVVVDDDELSVVSQHTVGAVLGRGQGGTDWQSPYKRLRSELPQGSMEGLPSAYDHEAFATQGRSVASYATRGDSQRALMPFLGSAEPSVATTTEGQGGFDMFAQLK